MKSKVLPRRTIIRIGLDQGGGLPGRAAVGL